ncbi:flavodoxin domain-containing protein [Microbulbifer litoralis]|uniref:flavodoxin domain-containing protein n=1 Tax=Microbulbifer litoralis TaxID=2933965 RepID=UPI0020282328
MTEFLRNALAVVAIVAWCAWVFGLYWRQRRARPAAPLDGAALVAYASQGGTAEALARQRAELLGADGEVQLLPLSGVSRETLLSARRALFVVSTYGEGEPPDNGRRFARIYLGSAGSQSLDLSHLSYSVVALGDRAYANFCAFGQRVHDGLAAMGARALEPLERIDSGIADGMPAVPSIRDDDRAQPGAQYWQLVDRQLLNPGSPGNPLYRIVLRACGPLPLWRAGDIFVVRPRLARQQVEQWLVRHGLDGTTRITVAGRSQTLVDWLGERQLSDRLDDARVLLSADDIAGWPLLPEREYSVASCPEEGRLVLLVRQQLDEQGNPGLGSGWLTRYAVIGDFVAGRIRNNASCRTPDHGRPLLLIGAGSGLAGLRAQLAERALHGSPGRAWLIIGERSPESDCQLVDEIAAWKEAGIIARCDRAFSRGTDDARYVQHILTSNADEVRSFLSRGADIYVCGSMAGMGEGVHEVLQFLLGDDTVEQLIEAGRYRRDLY